MSGLTLDETFAELAKLPGPWGFTRFMGQRAVIRQVPTRDDRPPCPLCVLATAKGKNMYDNRNGWNGTQLTFAEGVGESIAYAADNPHAPLRGRLLATLGLTEPS